MRTMQGRIGHTTIPAAYASNYRRTSTIAATATALALAATGCDLNSPPADEYAAICVDKQGNRVDEANCPYDDEYDEYDYYYDEHASSGNWFFYHAPSPTPAPPPGHPPPRAAPAPGPSIPPYGHSIRGTGGSYTKPPTTATVNPNGTISGKGATSITRGGFGIAAKGASSGT